jgi:glutathionyl-hydroquinone reductase
MGVLIDGKWTDGELPQETSQTGQFKRVDSVFRDRITADGASGFKAEPGRYHLYVAHGCPWAHRTLIYRAVKKLEGLIIRRLFGPRPQAERLDVRTRPALSRLHPRRGQRLPLSL